MTDNTVLAKLKFARNLLKKRGWAKTWEESNGQICAVASIRLASGAYGGTDDVAAAAPAVQYLENKLREKTDGQFTEIPVWNDRASTTFDDVIELFDEAIAELEH